MDASFAGEWSKDRIDQAIADPNTARSRTRYIIFYSGVHITWGSKLQVEIYLSSTKAEMLALSAVARENIHLIRVMADAAHHNVMMDTSNATLYCTVQEDNPGTVIIAREPHICPQTKHINQKYWHFITFLRKGLMSINWISTVQQLADLLTKPVGTKDFYCFTQEVYGWSFPAFQ